MHITATGCITTVLIFNEKLVCCLEHFLNHTVIFPTLFSPFHFLKALGCLFMLAYIHRTFSKNPINCLADYQDTWPRDGIMRVEIVSPSRSHTKYEQEEVPFPQSYMKEGVTGRGKLDYVCTGIIITLFKRTSDF